MDILVIQCFNALLYASILFLIAGGLSLILSLLLIPFLLIPATPLSMIRFHTTVSGHLLIKKIMNCYEYEPDLLSIPFSCGFWMQKK